MPRITAATVAEHRAQVRQRLLDAWGRLLAERSHEDVTLADLAAASGVGRTAIYNYFPDKDAVLLAYVTNQIEAFLTDLRPELDAAGTASERLRIFIRHHLVDFATRPLPAGPPLSAVVGDKAYAVLSRHTSPLQDVLQEVIEGGVAGGEFRAPDPAAAAAMAIACIGAERVPLGTGARTLEDAVEQVYGFLAGALGARADGDGR